MYLSMGEVQCSYYVVFGKQYGSDLKRNTLHNYILTKASMIHRIHERTPAPIILGHRISALLLARLLCLLDLGLGASLRCALGFGGLGLGDLLLFNDGIQLFGIRGLALLLAGLFLRRLDLGTTFSVSAYLRSFPFSPLWRLWCILITAIFISFILACLTLALATGAAGRTILVCSSCISRKVIIDAQSLKLLALLGLPLDEPCGDLLHPLCRSGLVHLLPVEALPIDLDELAIVPSEQLGMALVAGHDVTNQPLLHEEVARHGIGHDGGNFRIDELNEGITTRVAGLFGTRKTKLANAAKLVEESTDLGLFESMRKVAEVDNGRWLGGLGGSLFCLALLRLWLLAVSMALARVTLLFLRLLSLLTSLLRNYLDILFVVAAVPLGTFIDDCIVWRT